MIGAGIVAPFIVYKMLHNASAVNWHRRSDICANVTAKRSGISDEPDCSPHPFDILAIWALYQTVDR